MPSSQVAWGTFSPIASANGMSSSFEWYSNPFDMDDADSVSISLQALAEVPTAVLVVPSKTAGDGTLYVAQAAGAAGNNITVAHSAPAGAAPVGAALTGLPTGSPGGSPPATTPGANPYSVVASAITAAPWVGATNGQMAMLANQSTATQALVQAFPWGWGAAGNPVHTQNSMITQAALNDPLVVQGSANLAGGAAAAAINGIMTLEVCGELLAWNLFAAGPNDVVSGTLATAGSPSLELHVDRLAVRYGRLHWVPGGGGSAGQIAGTISMKGGAR